VSCLSTCVFPDKTSYPIDETMVSHYIHLYVVPAFGFKACVDTGVGSYSSCMALL